MKKRHDVLSMLSVCIFVLYTLVLAMLATFNVCKHDTLMIVVYTWLAMFIVVIVYNLFIYDASTGKKKVYKLKDTELDYNYGDE
jgi:hypothetical protein